MPRQRAVRVVCTEYTHRSRLTKKRHTDDRPRIRIGIFIIIAVPTRSLDFARRQCATDVCVRFARRLDRGRQTPFTPRSSPTPRERFDVETRARRERKPRASTDATDRTPRRPRPTTTTDDESIRTQGRRYGTRARLDAIDRPEARARRRVRAFASSASSTTTATEVNTASCRCDTRLFEK